MLLSVVDSKKEGIGVCAADSVVVAVVVVVIAGS